MSTALKKALGQIAEEDYLEMLRKLAEEKMGIAEKRKRTGIPGW